MRTAVVFLALVGTALAEDWTSLFDGKSLDGWTQRGGVAEYNIENGEIVGVAVPNTPNSFLCTEKNYGDFILELEFKVDPDLNSGVQIRSESKADYQDGRVHGYQVEIDPSDRAWSGGIYDEGRRGWLDNHMDNDAARYAFKQNEWNKYRVEAIGDSIRTWINGVPAANLTDDMTSEGFIALQVHGVGKLDTRPQVKWRNIRIQTENLQPTEVAAKAKRVSGPIVPLDAEVKLLHDGFTFTEGPSKGPDGRIYFNDIPNETTHVYDPATGELEVWREKTGRANGLWWTPGDRLLACEGGNRQLTRQFEGEIEVLADSFDGKKLNSPNDLILDNIGGIYFTDPRYGKNDDRELEKESVYYISRKGKITLATAEVTKPNGIIFNPDYTVLYVADPGVKKIWAFDVEGEGKLTNQREFAPIGSDGMTMDEMGNVYCTFEGKVWIHSPTGEELAQIECPEAPANVTFGGPDNRTLYITARKGFYSLDMNVAGAF